MNQQPQQTSSSHHNWYGFGAGGNASSGYSNSAATSGNNAYSGASTTSQTQSHGHSGHGHQTQHHRSMNMSRHTYTGMDGDQALYDLLRNNPAG